MADKEEKKSKIQKLLETEIPGVKRAKAYVDERLTKRIVEPLAKRGYEDLGAAIATIPSVAGDVLVPEDVTDVALVAAGPAIKGAGKAYKAGKKAIPAAAKQGSKFVKKLADKMPKRKPDLPEEYLIPDEPFDIEKEVDILAEQIKYNHDELEPITEPVMKPEIARKLARERLGVDDPKTSVAETSRYWGDPLYQKYSNKYRSKLTPKQLEELDKPKPVTEKKPSKNVKEVSESQFNQLFINTGNRG